jgi:hypothetical protein
MRLEEIGDRGAGIICGAQKEGCKQRVNRVCTSCGLYLCENEKCALLRALDDLPDRPQRVLCPKCAG